MSRVSHCATKQRAGGVHVPGSHFSEFGCVVFAGTPPPVLFPFVFPLITTPKRGRFLPNNSAAFLEQQGSGNNFGCVFFVGDPPPKKKKNMVLLLLVRFHVRFHSGSGSPGGRGAGGAPACGAA